MKSRQGEQPPWYTWRTPGIARSDIADPIRALERELTKFGEMSAYRERFAAERAKERSEAHFVAAELTEVATHSVEREAGIVRALVKRGGNRLTLPSVRPLPKFPDLNVRHS